jgi:hypothetical protein
VRVKPEVLRGFATQVGTASAALGSADVGHMVSSAGDGLAGSSTQWAARLVGAQVGAMEGKIATNVADMGVAVRGAGDRFEVTDDALAGDFGKVFS